MLLRAAVSGADALVFECNAVTPELQLVSTTFLDPDLTVITNARTDHRPEQGTADDAAISFFRSIPPGRAVATSDLNRRTFWENAAAERGARFFFVAPEAGEGLAALSENAACALAAADWLGLSRKRASRAIRSYRADPGAFQLFSWREPDGCHLWFADATAANDPESTDRLVTLAFDTAARQGLTVAYRILAVAIRPDRPDRSLLFADYAAERCCAGGIFDEAFFLGSPPPAARVTMKRSGAPFRVIPRPENILADIRVGQYDRDIFFVAAGNRQGLGEKLRDWALARFAAGADGAKLV